MECISFNSFEDETSEYLICILSSDRLSIPLRMKQGYAVKYVFDGDPTFNSFEDETTHVFYVYVGRLNAFNSFEDET